MSNRITTINSSVNISTNSNNTNKINSNNNFQELLNDKDYETILNEALETMTDMEKEAHLQTLEALKEEGFDEDDLKLINSVIIFMSEQKLENISELELSKEDSEIIEKYESIFEQIYKAIQDVRNARLQLKKLQMTTVMTDVLLKSKDNQDGIQTTKHTLNIEV